MIKTANEPPINAKILANFMKKTKLKYLEKSIKFPLTKSDKFHPRVGISKIGSTLGFYRP